MPPPLPDLRPSPPSSGVVPWHVFNEGWEWRQGEHVTMVGTTGCGKTTLGVEILGRRGYVCALGAKPQDRTLAALVASGWPRLHSWADKPPLLPNEDGSYPTQRVVLWPPSSGIDSRPIHRREFRTALSAMFRKGSWCCFGDEVSYLAKKLRLADELEEWWERGRSVGLSMVAATQRPAWIPRDAYSEASHLFLWATNDEQDLKRLSEISGPVDKAELRRVVRGLDFHRHEVAHVAARTGEITVTVPPAPPSAPARQRRRRGLR